MYKRFFFRNFFYTAVGAGATASAGYAFFASTCPMNGRDISAVSSRLLKNKIARLCYSYGNGRDRVGGHNSVRVGGGGGDGRSGGYKLWTRDRNAAVGRRKAGGREEGNPSAGVKETVVHRR